MDHLKNQILEVISEIRFSNGHSMAQKASEIIIKNKDAGFTLDISGISFEEAENLRQNAIVQISKIKNLNKISIVLTGSEPNNKSLIYKKSKQYIDNVSKIICVASGKGGVGKSTIAVALAENLSKIGKKVGLVDLDIYGPSIPTMLRISSKPEINDGKIIPVISRNLQVNSLGLLMSSGAPLAWRGPMASKAVFQLLSLSAWDNLDYLIIDTPPGTGDVHLSLLTNYHIDGAIIVTTPQKISAIDASKSIELYKNFNVPILALIKNMSYLNYNNNAIKIFNDNGPDLALKYGIHFNYSVLIDPEIANACDLGLSLAEIIEIPLEPFL